MPRAAKRKKSVVEKPEKIEETIREETSVEETEENSIVFNHSKKDVTEACGTTVEKMQEIQTKVVSYLRASAKNSIAIKTLFKEMEEDPFVRLWATITVIRYLLDR